MLVLCVLFWGFFGFFSWFQVTVSDGKVFRYVAVCGRVLLVRVSCLTSV